MSGSNKVHYVSVVEDMEEGAAARYWAQLSAGTADGSVVRGEMVARLGCCSSCRGNSCGTDTDGA